MTCPDCARQLGRADAYERRLREVLRELEDARAVMVLAVSMVERMVGRG